MTLKITEGNWGEPYHGKVFVQKVDEEGAMRNWLIADCSEEIDDDPGLGTISYEEREANANAIARVPDMLKLLADFANTNEDYVRDRNAASAISPEAIADVDATYGADMASLIDKARFYRDLFSGEAS